MKKIMMMAVAVVAAVTMMTSCSDSPTKTIENLKAAATGESNASAKYAEFATQALKDSMTNVAAMFFATSKAEAIHAENHIKVLKNLKVDFAPVLEKVVVGTTLENLAKAKEGEDYEQNTMYPGFITTSKEEKCDLATVSFNNAMVAEGKHSNFYAQAIKFLTETSKDTSVQVGWLVCPVCGDTYSASDVPTSCGLCGTAGEKFLKFGI